MKRIIIHALASGKAAPTPEVLKALKEFSDAEIVHETPRHKPAADEAPLGKTSGTDDHSEREAEHRAQCASAVLQRLLDTGLMVAPFAGESRAGIQLPIRG